MGGLRFNYVVGSSQYNIADIVNGIIQRFKKWIPSHVTGIAFIQQKGMPWVEFLEIFDSSFGIKLPLSEPVNRVIELPSAYGSGLQFEVVRLNCDVSGDFISRCFQCVQEKDITISIDGQIRVCTGWDNNMRSRVSIAHIDPDQPLVGISNVIRRSYGNAGFYGHFPFLMSKLYKKSLP